MNKMTLMGVLMGGVPIAPPSLQINSVYNTSYPETSYVGVDKESGITQSFDFVTDRDVALVAVNYAASHTATPDDPLVANFSIVGTEWVGIINTNGGSSQQSDYPNIILPAGRYTCVMTLSNANFDFQTSFTDVSNIYISKDSPGFLNAVTEANVVSHATEGWSDSLSMGVTLHWYN